MDDKYYESLRKRMIEEQLIPRGISDRNVLNAMLKVPREQFVPETLKMHAYDDNALPIGEGQTISQPYVVALTCQLLELRPVDKVLDIGTGSGYMAAVLGQLAKNIITIERIYKLAERATRVLEKLNYNNISVIIGDGSKGYKEASPYDGIASGAAPTEIPKAWLDQLVDGGKIVTPIGKRVQELVRISKSNSNYEEEAFGGVAFVPLVSEPEI